MCMYMCLYLENLEGLDPLGSLVLAGEEDGERLAGLGGHLCVGD